MGTETLFHIPTADSNIQSIVVGPDGNLWFSETNGNKTGRVTPTGTITEFPLGSADRRPTSIITGPDGNLWFIEESSGKIGRMTPMGVLTEFPTGTHPDADAITVGPDDNVWFVTSGGLGRITPAGDVTRFPFQHATIKLVPLKDGISGFAAGPDGNFWLTIIAPSVPIYLIDRVTPGGEVTEFPIAALPPDLGPPPPELTAVSPGEREEGAAIMAFISGPRSITAGRDGNLWFMAGVSHVGRITPAGQMTLFAFPGTDLIVDALTVGHDGNLWLTGRELSGHNTYLGRMTPAGVLTLFGPSRGGTSIVTGPDGTLWYTDGDNIRRFTVNGAP